MSCRLRPVNHALRTTIGITAVAATLALTGCVKLDADVALNGDDTFSGDVVIAFSDEILQQMDVPPEEFLAGMTEGSVDASEYETTPYAEDGYSGFTATFEDTPLRELENTLDITVEREDDEFVVEGEIIEEGELDEAGESGVPELDAMLEAMHYEVAITFPGPVSYTNGEADGTTVTWESTGGAPLALEARASALTQEELDEIARAAAEAKAAAEREELIRNLTIGVGAALGAAVLVALGIFFGRRAARKSARSGMAAAPTSEPAHDGGTTPGTAGVAGTATDGPDPAVPADTADTPSPKPTATPADTPSSPDHGSTGSTGDTTSAASTSD